MIDMNNERNRFEQYELTKRPCSKPASLFERFDSNGLGESEQHYVGKYVDSFMQEKWELWLEKAKAHTMPEGYVLFPKVATKEIDEILGMQCFQFIRTAQIYRKLGFEINKKLKVNKLSFCLSFFIWLLYMAITI